MEFGVISFLFVIVFCIQVSDEKLFLTYSSMCIPPKGDICIPIRQCPYFNDLLDNSPLPRPRNVIKIIRDHQCGFNGHTPYVCCNRPTTPPPETTTTTEIYTDSPISIDRFGESLNDHPNYHRLPQECGAIKADFRITNGEKTAINEYPWMALIFYSGSDGVIDFRCGGTLINKRYVLTAAHCVLNQTIVGIRLGDYNVETDEDCEPDTGYCAPPTQDVTIDKILIHPQYNAKSFLNDIALIKLNEPANIDQDNVKPICLPIDMDLTSRTGTVTGWGVTEDGFKSSVLLQVRLPILPLSDCQTLYRRFAPISTNQICAGGRDGHDSCGGDSGGPLQATGEVNGSVRLVQYGIVSFGPRYCGTEGKPGVYTKVSNYMEWILDHLEAN